MTTKKTNTHAKKLASRILQRPGSPTKPEPRLTTRHPVRTNTTRTTTTRRVVRKPVTKSTTTTKRKLNPIRVQNSAQRIGVFIDVQNMYYSAKNLYHSKVNFKNILDTATNGRQLIRSFAYVIRAEGGEEKNFFGALENMGIEIRAKDLQIFFGGAKKGDWDVGIAMDIMRMANKLDVICLVSGDGDFKDLLEHVKALGCRTEVFSFGRSSSSRIKEVADLFFDLDLNKDQYLIK